MKIFMWVLAVMIVALNSPAIADQVKASTGAAHCNKNHADVPVLNPTSGFSKTAIRDASKGK